jgi:integrating conjugative element protein (TIGR03755 family)
MIIQKVNPALYDLLQNGVLQASEEYHIAIKSCEEILKDIQGNVVGDGWKSLARAGYWREQSQSDDNEILAVKANTETAGLDRGVPWVAGALRGGDAQPPIEVIGDTAKAGYNLLLNRDPDNAMAMGVDCDGAALCDIWPSPQEQADWLVSVLGEHKVRTCQACDPLETRAGMGLSKIFEVEQTRIREALTDRVASSDPPTPEELAEVSGGPALTLSRRVIEAIREEQPEEQGALIERLAGEMAMSLVVEQALMGRRTLLSGMKEPNIANVDIAQTQLEKAVDELDREVDNLLFELEVRKRLAGNTPYLLLQRQRARASVPLIEGSPDNRLQDGAIPK